jgi:RsiW-degrading membrane proteinase PrsW (M82 family)
VEADSAFVFGMAVGQGFSVAESSAKLTPLLPMRNGSIMFTSFLRDLRYAFRALGWNPGFAWVSVLGLTLGIGANHAIFTVVHWVLLPLRDPRVASHALGPSGGIAQ